MIHSFQPEIPHDWYKHSDRFHHVWCSAFPTSLGHPRTEEIVQTENMCDIEIPQPCPAKSSNPGIPAQRSKTQPRRKVNRLHALCFHLPAKFAAFLIAPLGFYRPA